MDLQNVTGQIAAQGELVTKIKDEVGKSFVAKLLPWIRTYGFSDSCAVRTSAFSMLRPSSRAAGNE